MERLAVLVVLVVLLSAVHSEDVIAPKVEILVHVRKRAATYWEPWQLNSNICPPSLCRSSDEHGTRVPRPRGTGGTVFYQGDIVLDSAYEKFIYGASRRRRATMRLKDHLWKDGVVPYEYSPDISRAAKKIIRKALLHIKQRSCIKFRRKRTKDKDYIRYISDPGCWSNVGRKGGPQLLSIGLGCENLGVAVHETIHALGMWHEQARADRDQFVEIVTNNISPRFLPDFQTVDRRVSTSRGSPYDYQSIMHYSRMAFTRNGDPTIKVIGVGRELGLTIGQRETMSNLDVAQLRDMYRCPKKTDANETECPKDWIKWQASCYKFHDHPEVQYSRAQRLCSEEKARLLVLETKGEERFVTKYLNTQHNHTNIWRLGGKAVNGTMTWEVGSKTRPMKYSNWAPGQPSSFSSMTLVRNRTTGRFQWHGVWLGSASQLPRYMYAFICEKRAKRPCVKLGRKDGRDYRGKLDYTIDGYTCQDWTSQYPHKHPLKPDSDNDKDGLGKHNFCRNPSSLRRKRPWCYTTRSKREWQYCDVTACSKERSVTPSRGSPVQQQEDTPDVVSSADAASTTSGKDKSKEEKDTTKKRDPNKKNKQKRNKKGPKGSKEKKDPKKPRRERRQKEHERKGSSPSRGQPRPGSTPRPRPHGRRRGTRRPRRSSGFKTSRPPSTSRPRIAEAVPARPSTSGSLKLRKLFPVEGSSRRPPYRSRLPSRKRGGNSLTRRQMERVVAPTQRSSTYLGRREVPLKHSRRHRRQGSRHNAVDTGFMLG